MLNSGFVIIEGNIGVGKSTFAKELSAALEALDVSAEYLPEPDETTNPFLAQYYAECDAVKAGKAERVPTAYKMQLHLLHQRFKTTRYAQAAALAGKGWFILDRSYYGDLAFARVQKDLGYFEPAECESYLDAHRNMREFLEMPTASIFLKATPECCLNRIKTRARGCEVGIELSYLERLSAQIDVLREELKTRGRVIELDWNAERGEGERDADAVDLALQLVALPRDTWDF